MSDFIIIPLDVKFRRERYIKRFMNLKVISFKRMNSLSVCSLWDCILTKFLSPLTTLYKLFTHHPFLLTQQNLGFGIWTLKYRNSEKNFDNCVEWPFRWPYVFFIRGLITFLIKNVKFIKIVRWPCVNLVT